MPCSYLTSHPSGLIPIPFGLTASCLVKLLSFSFFRFFCFLLKIFCVFTYVHNTVFTYLYREVFMYICKTVKTKKRMYINTHLQFYKCSCLYYYLWLYIWPALQKYFSAQIRISRCAYICQLYYTDLYPLTLIKKLSLRLLEFTETKLYMKGLSKAISR